jgi:hypothetical protein
MSAPDAPIAVSVDGSEIQRESLVNLSEIAAGIDRVCPCSSTRCHNRLWG